ncbi:hypothetical protein QTN47_11815 [Danxiaibacter flavus]|uniref:SxtJ n=1 Tax=Danxiaibacter flavus TaxID=3049108 RepID=A0ABV3ZI47_9BACT|nr:hypothetical protein QNM32_11820 [Chitinophagaceae bacterium DXS]
MKSIKKIFEPVTKKQCIEFGVVAILVMAMLALFNKQNGYVIVIMLLCLVSLIVPLAFYPFTVIWFGLAKILSSISSQVILTIIYFLVVTPVGLIRKLRGADGMKIKAFKKSGDSVMLTRDHAYSAKDFEHTF